jgi:uncharacterized protein (DUF1697 family)
VAARKATGQSGEAGGRAGTGAPSDVHVALLRGINVGGAARLPMKSLVSLVVDAGCRDVGTYIQSGNVVFRASAILARRVPKLVSDAIAAHFGFRVTIMVRTAAELSAVTRINPFLRAGEDPKSLHVGFLEAAPTRSRVDALDPKRSPPDEFSVRGREIYLLMPNGVGKSKLTTAYLESKLGTPCTVRNWRTVLALVDMCSALG